MTVTELIRELQKIENNGLGDGVVMISDFSETDNPTPRKLYFVRPRFRARKVFLESEYRSSDLA